MSKEINLFEKASRVRVRFDSRKGQVTLEDLWSLPLSVVDEIAVATDKVVNATQTESFISKVKTVSEMDVLRLDLLKHIIAVRLVEAEEKQKARLAADRKAHLLSLLAEKEAEADQKLSREDILKELETL